METFRKPKLIDVTFRDGGFANGFSLNEREIDCLLSLLTRTAADVLEIGYVGGLPSSHGQFGRSGPTFDLSPAILKRLVSRSEKKCCVMLHPNHPNPVDPVRLREAGVALVRIPCQPSAWRQAINTVKQVRAFDLPVAVNFTLASWWKLDHLLASAREAEGEGVVILYLADTNSALSPRAVSALLHSIRSITTLPIGFHAHDGKGLALANVDAALASGASWIDASVFGIGRGPGNAPMESVLDTHWEGHTCLRSQLRCIPEVLKLFGLNENERVWERLCSMLDLSPPCVSLLDSMARTHNINRFELGLRLIGRIGGRPLTSDEFDGLLVE